MDENGKWNMYWDNKPYLGCVSFVIMGGGWLKIPTKYAPKNYKGDWKDSLFNVEKLKRNFQS